MNETELKYNNFQNFLDKSGLQPQVALTIDELFELLEKYFDVFRESANLKAVLPIVHNSVRLYARRDFANNDIGLILLSFYENHHEDEEDLLIFVQILHQVLHSLDTYYNKEIIFSQKVFTQLIKQLLMLSGRAIVSNVIACLVLHKKYFPEIRLIQRLWFDLSQRLQISPPTTKTHIDILVQLFDEFYSMNPGIYNDSTLVNIIQFLLRSNDRDERKCGYFLFKKLMNCFIDALKTTSDMFLSQNHASSLQTIWSYYITILENLEENQSHLILPSLENLSQIFNSKQLKSEWLEVLIFRILTHNNILVLRWAVEFFLENFSCSMLSVDNLKHLLVALNSTVLYNYEGYFLDEKYFNSFLQGDLSNLYKQIGEINWKPVPLCNLINNLLIWCPQPQCVAFEDVLKISSRVRNITDKIIRNTSAEGLNKHLNTVVDKMTIEQYVKYIETLYTPGDICDPLGNLYRKQQQFDETKHANVFQKRFFEIVLRNISDYDIDKLISFLEQIPIKNHGWLRFLPFYQGTHAHMQRLVYLYGINMDPKEEKPQTNIDRFKIIQNSSPSKEELQQVNILLTVISVYKLVTLDGLGEDRLSVMLLESLPEIPIIHLCECLKNTTEVLEPWAISRLIDLCPENEIQYIGEYLEKKNLLSTNIEQLLGKRYNFTSNILEYLSKSVIFNSDIKKGESRIEECFKDKIFKAQSYRLELWRDQVKSYGDLKYATYLLDCYKDVSKRKQRYFANSYEHRVKMRIALGLAAVLNNIECSHSMCDEMWKIILNENNQLNITYFFEYVLSLKENRRNILRQKLEEAHNLTSSQQISIMSVIYNSYIQKAPADGMSIDQQSAIVKQFLALTMGANFYTRLFAQMALIFLMKYEKISRVPYIKEVISSIENATNQKVSEHNLDFRLNMHSLDDDLVSAWCSILYVTNAPFDEIWFDTFFETERFEKYRNHFCKKLEMSTKTSDVDSIYEPCYNQLQRKMNPIMDILEPSNLLIYPSEESNTEMVVIASLVDKLPNLGGIARTCEVLGIRNIVLNSKRDIEKSDFKNLSMTAEKSLNIIEVKQRDLSDFIINKRKEGFSVVGAEQTSTSKSFVTFKFPPKCILLLGHEKDGIPPTLLGLLDHAVEIPQFGQVRSLNVHVTGALFMWEYCKQHLIK